MILKKSILSIAFILIICVEVNAQILNDEKFIASINKTTLSIKIDGNIDEEAWNKAKIYTNFKQNFPFDTSYAKMQTEVKLMFDDNNLYISAVCYQPKKYIVQGLRRDYGNGSSDIFFVLIDPFKDKLNGFYFSVTPYGVQKEALIFNGNDLNIDWDNKWFSEAKQHDDKYVVEMSIPFKTLRYKFNDISEWNINFCRNNLLINERSSWASIGRNFRMIDVTFNGKLKWEENPPKPSSNISLIPYLASSSNKNFLDGSKGKSELQPGFDAKIALTTSLNLDLTVNSDFAQVEADQQITNLSRFEISFPERRQFFLENRDIFNGFGSDNINPFFSRRIGLAKNESNGQNVKVPIIAGARISGRINKNWRLGFLNIQTAKSEEFNTASTNFTVAAVQRRIGARSNIGFIAVNKDEIDNKLSVTRFNRVIGIDYNLGSQDAKWTGKYFIHKTVTPIAQEGQFAMAANLNYNDVKFRFNQGIENIGINYKSDLGYVPRNGYTRLQGNFNYVIFPKSSISKHINSISIGPDYDIYYGKNDKRVTDWDAGIFYRISFQNSAEISGAMARMDYTYLFSDFDPTNTGGLQLKKGTSYFYMSNRLNFRSNARKPFYYNINTRVGNYFNGNIIQLQANLNYRIQPTGIIGLDIRYTKINLPSPYNSTTLWLIGPKAELAFSRSLFLNAFFQYNNQINNFNTNIRFQWRFKPVSDFFLVYTDNYFATADDNTFVNGLPIKAFQVKNRAIVAKLTYWFNL